MPNSKDKSASIAKFLCALSTTFHKEFSGINSQVTVDIICMVVAHQTEPHLTVKTLFKSLPHSDMGIRYRFNQLVQEGYIELHNGSADTRIKFVKPAQKLLDKFTTIVNLFYTDLLSNTSNTLPKN